MKLTEKQRREMRAILADVAFGRTSWSQLHSMGHHFMTVKSCVKRGLLLEPLAYEYDLTPEGRAFLTKEEKT